MMPLSYIIRKRIGGYRFTKSQEKIKHLKYMDNIKLFAKKWKRTEKFLVGCLVCWLFYGVSTLFGSFNAELTPTKKSKAAVWTGQLTS